MTDEMEYVDGIFYEYEEDKAMVSVQSDDEIGEFIQIPESVRDSEGYIHEVTKIDEGAFGICHNLKAVVVPDSVVSIGDSAFMGCDNLKTVKLSNRLTRINEAAFFDCQKLETIVIPDCVTKIDKHAFWQCKNLRDLILPEELSYIGEEAFVASGLQSIFIPASVTFIGDGAFDYCKELTDIQVDIANTKYYSDGDKLIEKERGKVIFKRGGNVDYARINSGQVNKKRGFFQKLKDAFSK